MESPFDYDGFVPEDVKLALETAYRSKRRIRIWYGFTESHLATGVEPDRVGRSWGDEYDVTGTVGRSGGTVKVPLLINNARSLGGGAILLRAIVRIDDIKSGSRMFEHPRFVSGFEGAKPQPIAESDPTYGDSALRFEVSNDLGRVTARFETDSQAQRYIDFQNGHRWNK